MFGNHASLEVNYLLKREPDRQNMPLCMEGGAFPRCIVVIAACAVLNDYVPKIGPSFLDVLIW